MARLDIFHSTSMLCRFMHNLSIDCYSRAEELLNYYPYSTKGMTLVLGGKTELSHARVHHQSSQHGPCANLRLKASAPVTVISLVAPDLGQVVQLEEEGPS
eukprot:6214585-Pleurochrysis_carterae.AAC.1